MLVYDRHAPLARAVAAELEARLPVGYVVTAAEHLPAVGTLVLPAAAVRGSWAWVDADGTVHPGRQGRARAMRTCGGSHALLGGLLATPGLGRVVARLVPPRPAADVARPDEAHQSAAAGQPDEAR